MSKKIILVTSGDPSGIGPDICLDLVNYKIDPNYTIVILGDLGLLQERAFILNRRIKFKQLEINYISDATQCNDQLNIINIPCFNRDCIGKFDNNNAQYVLDILDTATSLCKNKKSNIIVTAPINKNIIASTGLDFFGHTEYFASKFECKKVVMMLANEKLKVALLTTHVPLKDVPKYITTSNLRDTLSIIINSLNTVYGIENPKIAVCGLNPHAGEDGLLGVEELDVINPVINEFKDNGYNVFGSYSADTVFNRAHEFDVILAMYHDQGLPVLKYSGFETGVNVTLGLPIIRTSVDHGTAIDLAGSGIASSKSLFQAIELAISCDIRRNI